jgi:hypothetical protein
MKNLLLLCIISLSMTLWAQDNKVPEKPVVWNTYIKQVESEPYIFITAKLAPGWHYFSNEPGGDGLAIPTIIKFMFTQDGMELEVPVSDAQADKSPTKHRMEGMGEVSYFEGEVTYSFPITDIKGKDFLISVDYQCCNDRMCLPPASEILTPLLVSE